MTPRIWNHGACIRPSSLRSPATQSTIGIDNWKLFWIPLGRAKRNKCTTRGVNTAAEQYSTRIRSIRSIDLQLALTQTEVGGLVIARSALTDGRVSITEPLSSLSPTVRLRRDHCDHTCRVVLLHEASEGCRHRVFAIYPSVNPRSHRHVNLTVIATDKTRRTARIGAHWSLENGDSLNVRQSSLKRN